MVKKLFVVFGFFLGVFLFLGIFSPTELVIEREITIEKPKEFVFSQIKFLKNHDAWSPWAQKDPNMKKEFRGTDGTPGFVSL